MYIEYLAHASFLVRSAAGTTIIIDPYDPAIGYGAISRSCDAMVISHDHRDHNHSASVQGRAMVLKNSPGRRNIGDITVRGVLACHDECGGARLGYSTIALLEVDGIRCCHAGDLGHLLTDEQREELGEVDLLLVPTGGGGYTIGPEEAHRVAEQVGAKVVIPMHHGTGQLRGDEFSLLRLDPFLEKQPRLKRLSQSVLEMTLHELPVEREIVVLNHTF
jgi:L-ascorbate metabolism protein UlaG (beta-lactamase superfamily)